MLTPQTYFVAYLNLSTTIKGFDAKPGKTEYNISLTRKYVRLRKPTRVKNNNRKFYFSRTNENISRSNEKFSRSNEKYSRNNEKYSRSNENISRSNEKNSRKNEKLSRRNENISRRNEN